MADILVILVALNFCLCMGLLYLIRQCRQELKFAKAKNLAAHNKSVAFDSLIREAQRNLLDLTVAHQAVQMEVLQVEQVRGRRVH